jgi:hypothetical protein
VGKALGIPDTLEDSVKVIVDGINADRHVAADILSVEASGRDWAAQQAHLIGFGGLGLFGEVPRFTETRLVKWYKGVLGTLFGDLGPFYVGLTCAAVYWQLRHILGRVPKMSLVMDGEETPVADWGSVIVLNGDLGRSFPLGSGLSFSSGDFRVVAIKYRGVLNMISQMNACRTGRILVDPGRYGATVRNVKKLVARPVTPRPSMVNVDGLRMFTKGDVGIRVAGRVCLISAGTMG